MRTSKLVYPDSKGENVNLYAFGLEFQKGTVLFNITFISMQFTFLCLIIYRL